MVATIITNPALPMTAFVPVVKTANISSARLVASFTDIRVATRTIYDHCQYDDQYCDCYGL